MRLLLDTHILVWTLTDPNKLSRELRARIEDGSNTILFSAASIWEIAIKAALGKKGFDYQPALIVDGARAASFIELTITSAVAMTAGSLPLIHRDPFDRMLIAQMIHESASLITVDGLLRRYSDQVEVI